MGHAPENTPASFELGWRMGADALECDVHLSKDGQLVVMHDEALDRTSSGTGLIRDARWSALRRLDAGGWYHRRFRGQRIWRLADLLRWMRDKRSRAGRPLRLVLEIKNEPVRYAGIAEAVVKALRAADFLGRTTAISFDHGVVKRVKVLERRLTTGILFHQALPDLAARVRWVNADAVFPRWTLVTPSLMRAARKLGAFVGVWTVNETADIKKMARAGVGGLATNFPDRAAELLLR
jgi:glycerophosphoryl diester phosphodiesterase